MSVIIAADLHLGSTTHGTAMRVEEARRVCRFIGAQVGDTGGLILAGDTFDGVNPPSWANHLIKRLVEGADCTIDAHSIRGNHDADEALSLFDALGVSDRPFVWHSDDGIDFALVPWFSRAYVAAYHPEWAVGEQSRYMADALTRIVADLAAKKREGVPMVCVTHFTISGATYDSGVQPELGMAGEFLAPWSAFDRPEFSFVISGHIHKAQDLHGGKLIYVGSPTRCDFGQENDPTYILRLDLLDGDVRIERIPTPAIEFVSVDVNARGNALNGDDVIGRVVRFVGELPAGEETAAYLRSLTNATYLAGALKVAKPAVRFTRHDAVATRRIEPEATAHEALTEFAAQVGGQYAERLPELLTLHDEIEEGLHEG